MPLSRAANRSCRSASGRADERALCCELWKQRSFLYAWYVARVEPVIML